jgi:hypothetical protein
LIKVLFTREINVKKVILWQIVMMVVILATAYAFYKYNNLQSIAVILSAFTAVCIAVYQLANRLIMTTGCISAAAVLIIAGICFSSSTTINADVFRNISFAGSALSALFSISFAGAEIELYNLKKKQGIIAFSTQFIATIMIVILFLMTSS